MIAESGGQDETMVLGRERAGQEPRATETGDFGYHHSRQRRGKSFGLVDAFAFHDIGRFPFRPYRNFRSFRPTCTLSGVGIDIEKCIKYYFLKYIVLYELAVGSLNGKIFIGVYSETPRFE